MPTRNSRWIFPAGPGAAISLLLVLASAIAAPPKPEATETRWPGITATIYQIARLPGNRVAVKFIYTAAHDAPSTTYIADRPIKSFRIEPNATSPEQQVYYPYSIEKKGQLIDEATGKIWPASELKTGDSAEANPGRTDALEMVQPNDAFFLGGVFECPPVNEDKPPKAQWIALKLPGLKSAITHVLLPREENVVVNFFPKPKTLPLGKPD